MDRTRAAPPTWPSTCKDAPINYDRNLRLQYLAGLGFNLRSANTIYVDIVRYRRFPEGLFSGSDTQIDYLRRLIGNSQGQ